MLLHSRPPTLYVEATVWDPPTPRLVGTLVEGCMLIDSEESVPPSSLIRIWIQINLQIDAVGAWGGGTNMSVLVLH